MNSIVSSRAWPAAVAGLLTVALMVSVSPSAHAERVRPELFGMDLIQQTAPSAPLPSTPTMRLIVSWSEVEGSPGRYDWASVDGRLDMARQHSSRPLLTIYSTPDFYALGSADDPLYVHPPKLSAYRAFVRALAQRYGSRVDYQLWAEMSVRSNYVGSPRRMAKMARIASQEVRAHAPRAQVVAPQGPIRYPEDQKWFRSFWNKRVGGKPVAKWVDVATLSGFPLARHGAERGLRLVKLLRRITTNNGFTGPIWIVEINYDVNGPRATVPISMDAQVANVVKTYVLNASIGTQRVYWHYWSPPVPNMNTAMLTADNQVAPPGKTFGVIQPWLIGTNAKGCTVTKDDIYSCLFTTKRFERRVIWTVSGKNRHVTTPERARRLHMPDGAVRRIRSDEVVRAGLVPVMIESRPVRTHGS